MGSNECAIDRCSSCLEDNGKCISCDKGFGLGGICIDETECNRCIKCGNKCKTCHLCICYECEQVLEHKDSQNLHKIVLKEKNHLILYILKYINVLIVLVALLLMLIPFF